MAHLTTVVRNATSGPRWSSLCSAASARPASIAPTASRTFASKSDSKKDDVPRTATGEVQKQTNFASEVGKKMQEAAPGGGPAESATSGKSEQPNQEQDKGGSK